jgi:tetratricopeptide (TPR) repeat protein
MRVLLLSAMVLSASGATFAAAQSVDEAAIRAVLEAETKAWIDRSPDAWEAGWLHDAKATRATVDVGGISFAQGWDKIMADARKDREENPKPLQLTATKKNFVIRQDGNLAFVEFDETLTGPEAGPTGTVGLHGYRVLVRDGGQWKIASQITHDAESFDSLENRINTTGYALLQKGKPQDAVEILKVNVHAYPDSWNAYDSLGEAYAAAGQKDLAIQNYQKSIELNPKNDNARTAPACLRHRLHDRGNALEKLKTP